MACPEIIFDSMSNSKTKLDYKISIEKIGNNLRVLKSMGIIKDVKIKLKPGRRGASY